MASYSPDSSHETNDYSGAQPTPERPFVLKIHGDIGDPPLGAADELVLAPLHVDPAQHADSRAAVVFLDEAGVYAQLAELVLAEGLDEEAALVAVHRRLDQDDALDLGGEAPEAHFSAFPYWRS